MTRPIFRALPALALLGGAAPIAFGQNVVPTPSPTPVVREEIVVSATKGPEDPADIPAMMRKLESSAADMVIGVRVNRQDTWARKIQSRIGNGVRNWITGDQITDTGCSLKLVKREAVEKVKLFTGMHRFLPTLVRMQGYKVSEMPVNHRARQFGVSKYGAMNRAFRGLVDCVAVRWMGNRLLKYEVREVPPEGGLVGEP